MTQETDRTRVIQNIKVRTSLKNDASWIQNSKVGNEVQEEPRADQTVEYRPIRLSSYVQSIAKKFEFHTPTEEQIQNAVAQPDKYVSDITTENNDEYSGTTVDQSNIEHIEVAPNGSADVSLETHTSNGEAVPPVEPTGQLAVDTKAVKNEIYANTADDQFNGEQDDVKVTEGDHMDGPIAELSNAAGTEDSQGGAEVSTAPPTKLIPEEEFSFKIETINVTKLEDGEVESTVQPVEGGSEKCAPEQNTEEIVQALADGLVETSPDMSDTIAATPGAETSQQNSVEPVMDLLANTLCEFHYRPHLGIATKESCDNGPPENAAMETVGAVAGVHEKSSTEFPDVIINTPGEEKALQDEVQPVPNLVANSVSESLNPSFAESNTEVNCDNGPLEQAAVECDVKSSPGLANVSGEETTLQETVLQTTIVERIKCEVQPAEISVVKQSVESTPENAADHVVEVSTEDVGELVRASDADFGQSTFKGSELTAALDLEPPTTGAASASLKESEKPSSEEMKWNKLPDEVNGMRDEVQPVPNLVANSVSESLNPSFAESNTEVNCDNGPLEQAAVECDVKSSPGLANVSGEETTLQETVLQTTIVERIKCEVQPAEISVVKQSVESTPENAADHVVEVSTEDVGELVRASDADFGQSTFKGSELTAALDLEPPTAGAASASLKESAKPSSEEMKWNKLSYEVYRNGICSVCDKKIDGNVKIKFDDPPLNCHPDCLKCASCDKALGDLLTTIFSHNQTIICGVCFAKTF